MKKSILFLATLLCTLAASATIHNVSSSFSWWVAGTDSPVQAGDTLLVADGEYVEQWSIDFQKSDLVVMAAEGAKPVIKASSYLKIHATTTFEGITFDGQNTSNYALTTRGEATKDLILTDCEFKNFVQYNIEIKENTTLTTLNIENCVFDGTNTTPDAIYGKGIVSQTTIQGSEFKNYTEYCIYANDYYGARYDNLTINNCLFHDCAYSAVFLANAKDGLEKQSCSDFTLTNSTIYNVGAASTKGRGVVELRTNSNITSDQAVLIDHVTLYNFASSENAWSGGFYIGNSANTKISNCIAMNPEDKKTLYANPYHAYTGAEITNSLYFNCDYNAEHGATTSESLVKADPKFVDAANADFMLYAESPAVGAGTYGSNLGDPRWGVKAGIQPGEGKLKAAVDAAEDGATIILGDETYEVSTSIEFNKEGLTIVAAEGTSPIIKLVDEGGNSSLKLSATTTFDGITFDGNNITKYPVTSTGTDANQFTFVNCEFKNYTKWAITNEYRSSHVDNVIIDKCLFHDGGSAVYFNSNGYNGQHSCSYFKMTNTTIYNINYDDWGVGVIHVSANGDATGEQNEVEIDHITMYNVSTKEYGAITVRKSSKLSVTNSIIANPASNSNKYAFYIYGGNVTNTLYHNSKVNSDAPSMNTINADPLFVNATNANFMLSANSPAVGKGTDGSNLGDPRWGVSASLKGKVINITPGQAKLNNAVGSASICDTIVLADGTYDEPWGFDLDKEGLVIMAAKGATPVVELSSADGWTTFTLSATTTFDGITFDGKAVCKYMLQTNATDISKLAFYNCEFRNYAKYAISNPDAGGTHVDSVIIDNCLFHDGAGSAVNFNNKGYNGDHACSYFKMTNSSVYNIGSSANAAITIRANDDATGAQNKVIIDHITLYNYATSEYGGIAIRKTKDLQITNSIIANPSAGLTAIYHYSEVQNNLFHNVTLKTSDGAAYNAACITADPLFVDAANGNFKLKGNSLAVYAGTDGTTLGDPRWGITPLELNGEGDDAKVLENYNGKVADVKITRSFVTNDGYHTICLPFDMPANKIGNAYQIETINAYADNEIEVKFAPVTTLLAGQPYLIVPNKTELEEVKQVTITNQAGTTNTVSGGGVSIKMTGVLSENGTTSGLYWVGDQGWLYNGDVHKLGLRAYFEIDINTPSGIAPRMRVVTSENEATGLDNITTNEKATKAIVNGQLVIIRGGEMYNVQGQKL